MNKNYYFELGNDSFGEIYHVALHGMLIPEEERQYFGLSLCDPLKHVMRDFLDDIEVSYSVKNCGSFRGLSETARTIFDRFHRRTIEEYRNRICSLAKREKWQFPMHELATPDPKVLIWQRNDAYEPHRNSSMSLIGQLVTLAIRNKTIPVVCGPKRGIAGAVEIGDFHENPIFADGHSICKQLWFQHMLFAHFGAKASVGMMCGALDGAAIFFEHRTVFLARERDAKPRMAKVAAVVPGLNWLQTEYDEYLALLNERQISQLEEIIWPTS